MEFEAVHHFVISVFKRENQYEILFTLMCMAKCPAAPVNASRDGCLNFQAQHARCGGVLQRCVQSASPHPFLQLKPERWHRGFLKGGWNCNHFPSLPSLVASAVLDGFLTSSDFCSKTYFHAGLQNLLKLFSFMGKDTNTRLSLFYQGTCSARGWSIRFFILDWG